MKLRFADQSIRCRATRAELEVMLSGRAVAFELALPRDRLFRVSIRPSQTGPWQFDSDPTGMWITIPMTELQALFESLPSRKGIEHQFELANGSSITVSFEVDVREVKEGDRR